MNRVPVPTYTQTSGRPLTIPCGWCIDIEHHIPVGKSLEQGGFWMGQPSIVGQRTRPRSEITGVESTIWTSQVLCFEGQNGSGSLNRLERRQDGLVHALWVEGSE